MRFLLCHGHGFTVAHRVLHMSATQFPSGTRSVDELNEQIRCLMLASGGWLSDEQRVVYADLVTEWALAALTASCVVVDQEQGSAEQKGEAEPPSCSDTPVRRERAPGTALTAGAETAFRLRLEPSIPPPAARRKTEGPVPT